MQARESVDNLSRLCDIPDGYEVDLDTKFRVLIRDIKKAILENERIPERLYLLSRDLEKPRMVRCLMTLATSSALLKSPHSKEEEQEVLSSLSLCRKMDPDEVELGELIGKGVNKVYKGTLTRDVSLGGSYFVNGTRVAVKRIPLPSRDALGELMAWSLLTLSSHPNILNLLGMSLREENGECFLDLTMEMAEGIIEGTETSLTIQWGDLRVPMGDLSLKDRVRILYDVARGLLHIHLRGLVHGDLKILNILLMGAPGRVDRVVLSDFGNTHCSTTKGEKGTVLYCAPASYEKGGQGSQRDMYSFGFMMWEILVGRTVMNEIKEGGEERFPMLFPNFKEDSPWLHLWMEQHLEVNHLEPVPLEGRVLVDRVLVDLIERCWLLPESRISSYEMCSDLDMWLKEN